MKVIHTVGLQGSGKSTYAKQICKDPKWKRVNRDDLRLMLDATQFNSKNEKFVTTIENNIIMEALRAGKNLVIDNMNLNPKYIEAHKKMIREEFPDTIFETKSFLDVSLEKCIENDRKRPNGVGEGVIKNTYMRYFDKRREMVDQGRDGANGDWITDSLYIFDIDGTLAKMIGRKPFEWSRVGEDLVREGVADVARNLKENGNVIYIFSGRDSVCRSETEKWLRKNRIPYDGLFMRAEGDNRKDAVIKEELFMEHVAGNGVWVAGVFDDRPVMCRKWREMGLTVFNCDDRLYHTEF